MGKQKYYTSDELDIMVKESLLKSAKNIASEIKKEKIETKKVSYV